MATVQTTLKINLDEANLLLKLLEEGEERRQARGKAIAQEAPPGGWSKGDPKFTEYQLCGQEVMAIQALRRGLKGVAT